MRKLNITLHVLNNRLFQLHEYMYTNNFQHYMELNLGKKTEETNLDPNRFRKTQR